ncbi:GGDEF domain-containing protein [Halothiobacillus neapolitanus]|uniref:Diguanylate cyclase with PAS/PAC sensor n=1 Tax=Halothiobacillus neapolitanus (strain ATCC 23641 / DSM 15147 / CIP 104769 / NCIMB 8539 / c2) TaxID=555778 RepID=D0L073_HALNC|nr:GGDEF domain-containing protein [Halothiobacillus neapolitanus]ACX96096.1 diguanylate cyclase with PAS/PAC sensor [Halothiobacillus neapolitanus c2]TDN66403.1 PAS domain S-box-containing protein/diguanylate cyclase (GGDEF)-like protein [Halothiobacillus neapolitanus]
MPKSAPFQAPPDTLDRLPVSVLILLKEQIIYANPAALSLLQADAPEQVLGHSVEDFLHPLDYQRVMARIRRAERTQFTNPPTEYRIYTCTRELRIIGMMSTTYMIDGQPGLLAAFMDMTERSVIEQRLRESDEQFHRMMNTMQDVFYRTDAEGITRFVCPAVKEILGYTASEIIGRPASDFYPNPHDRENLKKAILGHGFVRDFPGQMRRKDGRIIDISISSTVILDEEGKYAGVEGIWRDITERMQLERELERLATTDELTGIANRRQILQQLDHAYKRFIRLNHSLVVFILDLDFFKNVNDQYGHVSGDILLKEFIARVQQQIREIDYLGRLGGEEFLLILDETSKETAEQIGQRILQVVRQTPFDLGAGVSVTITVSIGATSACHKDAKITELLEHADKALYAAKDSGRNKICWYCEQTS